MIIKTYIPSGLKKKSLELLLLTNVAFLCTGLALLKHLPVRFLVFFSPGLVRQVSCVLGEVMAH